MSGAASELGLNDLMVVQFVLLFFARITIYRELPRKFMLKLSMLYL